MIPAHDQLIFQRAVAFHLFLDGSKIGLSSIVLGELAKELENDRYHLSVVDERNEEWRVAVGGGSRKLIRHDGWDARWHGSILSTG